VAALFWLIQGSEWVLKGPLRVIQGPIEGGKVGDRIAARVLYARLWKRKRPQRKDTAAPSSESSTKCHSWFPLQIVCWRSYAVAKNKSHVLKGCEGARGAEAVIYIYIYIYILFIGIRTAV